MAGGYCALSDVNAYVPQQPFGDRSVPSGVQVQVLIEQIASEIDASLGPLGYVTPVVDGPQSLTLLLMANAWGALGLALDARSTSVVRDDMLGGARNAWTQRYQDWKKALQDPKNPYQLPDAQLTSDRIVKPVGRVLSSTDDLPQGYDYLSDPPFSIGMKL